MTDNTSDEENHGVREMEREEYENLIEKLNNKLANLSPPPQPCIASYVNQRHSPKALHVIRQALRPHHIVANAIILYKTTKEKIIQWRNIIFAQATHVQAAVFQLSVHVIGTNNINDNNQINNNKQISINQSFQ